MTATTSGHQFLPAGLPRLAVGSWRVDPARDRRLPECQGTEHELACQLDLHLGGTRPDGSPRILVAGSWIIDSRWITSQRIPALGRRVLMTCSFSVQPDM